MTSINENQMLKYQRTLKTVADAAGSSLPYGVAPEQLQQNINPNTVYWVRCSDRKEYYRTIYLKPNPFTSNHHVMMSTPLLEDIPIGKPEVSPEAVLQRSRELNLSSYVWLGLNYHLIDDSNYLAMAARQIFSSGIHPSSSDYYC